MNQKGILKHFHILLLMLVLNASNKMFEQHYRRCISRNIRMYICTSAIHNSNNSIMCDTHSRLPFYLGSNAIILYVDLWSIPLVLNHQSTTQSYDIPHIKQWRRGEIISSSNGSVPLYIAHVRCSIGKGAHTNRVETKRRRGNIRQRK